MKNFIYVYTVFWSSIFLPPPSSPGSPPYISLLTSCLLPVDIIIVLINWFQWMLVMCTQVWGQPPGHWAIYWWNLRFPPKKSDSPSSSKCRADQITQLTKGLDSTSVKLKWRVMGYYQIGQLYEWSIKMLSIHSDSSHTHTCMHTHVCIHIYTQTCTGMYIAVYYLCFIK